MEMNDMVIAQSPGPVEGKAALTIQESIMYKTERKSGGFTLTELMIAILILGLIAVLSLPGYGRFMQNWKLNGEAEQFASALRTARASAVMKNMDVVFSFDEDNGTYFYFEDANGDGGYDNNEYMSATYELYTGIVITAHTLSTTTLTFGGKGNTRESGMITFRNSVNTTKNVRIFGGTGNIRVD